MSEHILLSVPEISGNEWKYIKECLDTNWVSSAGKYVDKFEKEICNFTNAKYAVACINGTAALHISLLVAGVEKGDEVIVPTLTFISPVNTINYVGAHPVFIDSESEFFNIDVQKIEDFCINECHFDGLKLINKNSGRTVKAIIPVHIFGNPCEMDALLDLAKKYNLKIIEDATESLGSKYKTKHTGTIGDIGCYSFNGNKIITTGGGGVIVTDNKEYAEKARYLTTQAKDDSVYYEHNEIGYNYRMTNITAAFGCAQLERLKEFIEIKRNNSKLYSELISDIDGVFYATKEADGCYSNHWFYTIAIDEKVFGKNIEQLIKEFASNKIQVRPIWKLNHEQEPYINEFSYKIANAETITRKCLNIPCSVNLTEDEIKRVVGVLSK